MNWENLYTVFLTIERNPDGSFKREDGQKKVKFFEKWQDATKKTKEQIEEHFKNRNAGLALVTGKKNGITVIDFDTKDNELSMELFLLAPTKTVATEKGFHYYYKYCGDDVLYTKANAFGDGVDCRNDGGLIFCPPTPNYIPNDDEIGELTPEALELLKSRATVKKANNLVDTTTRNDDLFRKACGWIEHYEPQQVWNKMVEANKNFRKGSLNEEELEVIYQQVIKYKKTGVKPEDQPKYQLKTLTEVEGNINDEPRYPIGFPSIDDVMKDEEYFNTSFQGGVANGEFIAMAGRPGEGKTLLSAQINTSLQTSGVKSIWFSYEAKLKKLKRIFERQGANLDMVTSVDVEKGAYTPGNINWIEEQILLAIKKYGVKMVVIDNLDFLENRTDREANYSMNQQAFLSAIVAELTKLTVQHDIILILIAHVRKPQNQGYKVKRPFLYDIAGTSSVERLCNFGLVIEREKDQDISYLYLDKNREGGQKKKIGLRFRNGQLFEDVTIDLNKNEEF